MPTMTVHVTTTGSAGSASGDTTIEFPIPLGFIDAIELDYHGSAPATTDVTVVETDTNGLEQTILSVSDNNTDGTYYPRHKLHLGADGSELTNYGPFVVEGKLKVSVVQCDALTNAVIAKIRWFENASIR